MIHLVIGLLFGIAAAAILAIMWRMVAALGDDAGEVREEIETFREPPQDHTGTS